MYILEMIINSRLVSIIYVSEAREPFDSRDQPCNSTLHLEQAMLTPKSA